MKILLVTQYFYPENFKSNDVAFELSRCGHEVTVLTGIPNYPQGKFYDGYGVFRKRKEIVNGVTVYRTFVIPRGKGGGLMMALNYMSWAFIASIWALFMSVFTRFDAIIVHETSPITQGIPAMIVKWLRKTPIYFWVLDLWPESLQVAGGINNKYILGFFEWIAKLCYRTSDKILISSRGFKESICQKGDFESKIVYFPNWAEDVLTNVTDYTLPELPNGFIVMFAGNIGEAQDFEHTLSAAKILKQNGYAQIHFVFVGDGRKRVWVEDYILENQLQDTVHWVGRHPLESMGKFFERADVLYFALKDSIIFNLTCPAKLQAYMSAGKPVVAMINGEGAQIVAEAGCGLTVSAGESEALADTIVKMSLMNDEELEVMGANGKEYCKMNFSFHDNINKLLGLIINDSQDEAR